MAERKFHRVGNEAPVAKRKVKTNPDVTAGKIAVRIDARTIVFVNPGTDIQAVRQKYSELLKPIL